MLSILKKIFFSPRLRTFWLFVVLVGLIVLNVYAWTPAFTQAKNTLEANGRWEVTKNTFRIKIMGADRFYGGLQSLSSEELNLGAWHGYQMVTTKQPLNVHTLEFDYRFHEVGFLMALLNYGPKEYDAIRIPLSTEGDDASLLKVRHTGEFISRKDFPWPVAQPDEWHHVRVAIENERINLSLDVSEVATIGIELPTEQRIGFHAGLHGVFLDNVLATGRFGQPTFLEGFDNGHYRRRAQYLLSIGITGGCGVLALILALLRMPRPAILANLNAVLISAIAAGWVVSTWYLPVLGSRYPILDSGLREKEKHWTELARDAKIRELEAQLRLRGQSDDFPVVFVGSSQTFGVGARSSGEEFVTQVEKILEKQHPCVDFKCFNLGINGLYSTPLFEVYEALAARLAPKICIINLGCNDLDYPIENFEASLMEFVELNREMDVQTVFVKEAYSPEVNGGSRPTHVIMDEIGRALGIAVIDSHAHLLGKSESGLLWWDLIHPSSYGHRLIAEKITEQLNQDVLPRFEFPDCE